MVGNFSNSIIINIDVLYMYVIVLKMKNVRDIIYFFSQLLLKDNEIDTMR